MHGCRVHLALGDTGKNSRQFFYDPRVSQLCQCAHIYRAHGQTSFKSAKATTAPNRGLNECDVTDFGLDMFSSGLLSSECHLKLAVWHQIRRFLMPLFPPMYRQYGLHHISSWRINVQLLVAPRPSTPRGIRSSISHMPIRIIIIRLKHSVC